MLSRQANACIRCSTSPVFACNSASRAIIAQALRREGLDIEAERPTVEKTALSACKGGRSRAYHLVAIQCVESDTTIIKYSSWSALPNMDSSMAALSPRLYRLEGDYMDPRLRARNGHAEGCTTCTVILAYIQPCDIHYTTKRSCRRGLSHTLES